MARGTARTRSFASTLRRRYALYTLGFLSFIALMGFLERGGMPRAWIGYGFLSVTVLIYAVIGVACRTGDVGEYYVAGRRVPPMFNGMAIAADWMSAASFISLAGVLYLQGYGGLAFVMGWTGGYVLVALLLAPYLQRSGQFTIPDFLGVRYGGDAIRLLAAGCAVFVSFVYLVAQIYGVGLITARLGGITFEIGVFVGLGGVLVCSFLGGMRAITWTQCAQYVVLIVAYLLPVGWLSYNHSGMPVPQVVLGKELQKVAERERDIAADPREQQVRAVFAERARRARELLDGLPESFRVERERLVADVETLRTAGASAAALREAQAALNRFPRTVAEARASWSRDLDYEARAKPPAAHVEPFPGATEAERDATRRNFLALVFCLMVGTAALPHILMRFYTTPTAHDARSSAAWSLVFISLLYVTAPALAVLVKVEVYSNLVGTAFADLPAWLQSWTRLDASLVSFTDANRDGILQLAELTLGGDVVVLGMPEIAGLPTVISALVAAGGLAAALSTADGLLLTISNALSHDLYYKVIDPQASTHRRVALSKLLLLVVALLAAYVATLRIADILFLVSAAFSLAASTLFAALVLGIFWKGATRAGAVTGMVGGFLVCAWYMSTTQPWLRSLFGVTRPLSECLWWDIQPVAAGVFGVPVSFALTIAVSLLMRRRSERALAFVDYLREPDRTVR